MIVLDSNNKNNKLDITFLDWIKFVLSFRYISNISIVVAVLAYWMQAYEVFFICIPLIITNFVGFVLLTIFDLDKYMQGILGRVTNDLEVINSYKPHFVIFNIIWHTVPLFWIYSVLTRENLVQLFRPNFMSMFLKSALVAIVYFYYERDIEPYGKVDYLWYFIVYMMVLFGSNVFVYLE